MPPDTRMTRRLGGAVVRWSIGDYQVSGDRLIPSPIVFDLRATDEDPMLTMRIEVVEGVPRCTELTLKSSEGGRPVGAADLAGIDLRGLVEACVTTCGTGDLVDGDVVRQVDNAVKVVHGVRKGSRRPLAGERMQRVADVYNAHRSGGIEAVEAAFVVSRSTAIRYIKAAREAGLLHT